MQVIDSMLHNIQIMSWGGWLALFCFANEKFKPRFIILGIGLVAGLARIVINL